MNGSPNVRPLVTGGARAQTERRAESAWPSPRTVTKRAEGRARPLLLLERTMYRDGVTPFTSVFTVSLRGDLNELKLRQALAKLQAKHPLLCCVVEDWAGGPRFVYHCRPAPVRLRLVERSNAFDWEREAHREWVRPFEASRDPLVRLVWLRGDGLHELMLVAHHCICDGPSGMTLLRDLFDAYDNPQWQASGDESFGALEDLVPEKLLRDKAFRRRVWRRAILLRLALAMKIRRGSGRRRCPSSEEMYFHRWQLHAMEAEVLTQRCREEDVTVLAAAGVAILQAFREVRGAGALKHAYSMVNARRFLPHLNPDSLFGIAPGVEVRMKRLPSPADVCTAAFWECARAFRKSLAVGMERLGSRFYETLAALETFHDRYPRLIADTDAAPAVRHVTFSNLGRLDLPRQYRGFRIERVHSPLVMVSPSPANTVVLSSFGGAIEFAIISDEQSLPQRDAVTIQQRAMVILRASAGTGQTDRPIADPHACEERAARR